MVEEFSFVIPPGSVEDLKKTTFCVRFVLWILVYFTKTIIPRTL